MDARDWDNATVDVDFLINSGLLFMLNLEVLHPLGIALTVKPDKTLGFKDGRRQPGKVVFDVESACAGKDKLDRFMADHGQRLLAKRKLALGRTQQDVNPKE